MAALGYGNDDHWSGDSFVTANTTPVTNPDALYWGNFWKDGIVYDTVMNENYDVAQEQVPPVATWG